MGYDSGPFGSPPRLTIILECAAVVTRGGVTFISATLDYFLRAFDTVTGELLWDAPAHRRPGDADQLRA
jgi:quinoprotein glucose dehydrogenase